MGWTSPPGVLNGFAFIGSDWSAVARCMTCIACSINCSLHNLAYTIPNKNQYSISRCPTKKQGNILILSREKGRTSVVNWKFKFIVVAHYMACIACSMNGSLLVSAYVPKINAVY